MITCAECIKSLRPDDPRVKSGKYGMCGCDYCDKPDDLRERECELILLREKITKLENEVDGKEVVYRYIKTIEPKETIKRKSVEI